jgi:hypothetical protein
VGGCRRQASWASSAYSQCIEVWDNLQTLTSMLVVLTQTVMAIQASYEQPGPQRPALSAHVTTSWSTLNMTRSHKTALDNCARVRAA